MPISDICNRSVVSAEKNMSVLDAAKLMRHHHVGDLVVVEMRAGKPVTVGIVTDRDIVLEVVAMEVDGSVFTVADLMSPELATVQESAGVFETVQLMRIKGVRRMPVTDAAGHLSGIIAVDDLIQLLAEEMSELSRLIAHERAHEEHTRK